MARRLNDDVFLPVFTIDADKDQSVAYVMRYALGLIAEHFVAVVTRFASLLEFIIQNCDRDGLIVFGAPDTVAAAGSAPTSGELLH